MLNNRSYATCYQIAHKERSKTDGCDAANQDDDWETLNRLGICQLQMMLVCTCSEKDLTHHAENIDSRCNNAGASQDSEEAVEGIGVLE